MSSRFDRALVRSIKVRVLAAAVASALLLLASLTVASEAKAAFSPPETTIVSAPPAVTSSTSATFKFKSNWSVVRYQCSIDGAAFSRCVSPKSYSSLSAGAHTFRVRAVYLYLFIADPSPATFTWTIDNTTPETEIVSGPPSLSSSHAPSFSLASSEQPAAFRCRVDDGAYAACGSEVTLTLGDGTHTLFAVAVDGVGNVDPTPAMRAFTIHSTPPDTVLQSAPPDTGVDSTVSFSFSALTDTLPYPAGCDPRYMFCATVLQPIEATFECSLDGAAFAACQSPRQEGPLGEGPHEFQVRAIDETGVADPSPAVANFTIESPPATDTTPPDTYHLMRSNAGDAGGNDNVPTPTFSFTATEFPSTFECKLEPGGAPGGAPFGPCSTLDSFVVETPLLDGTYTFSVRATDAAGNTDPTPATRSYVLDTDPPKTTIMSGPTDPTANNRPPFVFAADEPNSYFECKIETGSLPASAAFHGCASNYQPYSPLRDGTYTLSVRAFDYAYTRDPSPATFTFTVDTGWVPGPDTDPPDTTITQSPDSPTSFSSILHRFSSSETGSSFECKTEAAAAPGSVDFGICSNGPSGIDGWKPPAAGDWVFSVRAIDADGNIDPTPAEHAFRVTLDTFIDVGPNGTVDYNHAFFHLSAVAPDTGVVSPRPVVTFECKLNNAATPNANGFAPCSGPDDYHVFEGALADGSYVFAARATDASGVVDPTPAERTFTIDTSKPDTLITAGPAATTADNTPSFEFSSPVAGVTFECSIDSLPYSACVSGFTLPYLTERAHTFRVRAVGATGADLTPASSTFTVDTSPPAITIPAAGCTVVSNVVACQTMANPYYDYVHGCTIDGAQPTGCGRSFIVRLPAGTHTIQVEIVNDIGETRYQVLTVTIPS